MPKMVSDTSGVYEMECGAKNIVLSNVEKN